MAESLSYKDAGVDIDAGDALVERIKPLARRTLGAGVLAGIGGFGALFELPTGLREPVLVSSTDGVGTKLKLAFELDGHDTVGIDLVAMSVNDILVQGARPLFFLDYFACGKLEVGVAERVIGGVAAGCEQAGCALIGGETAEMPGMYAAGEYDLAGFAVGVVEKSRILDASRVQAGDAIVGLASSGVHSNGFSLVRRIVERSLGSLAGAATLQLDAERTLAQALLAPTRIYVKPLLGVFEQQPQDIHALAHITGGGIVGNVPRVLPDSLQAVLDSRAWQQPALFDWLQREGGVERDEMHRVFNCGLGMVAVVPAQRAQAVVDALRAAGEQGWQVGEVVPRPAGAPQAVVS